MLVKIGEKCFERTAAMKEDLAMCVHVKTKRRREQLPK